jgi:Glycosyl hydrolases family 2, TIM barrel domain/Glycosyl hydrolases family 2
VLLSLVPLPASTQAALFPPRETALSNGWEVRSERAAPAEPQPPPPPESAPDASIPTGPTIKARATQASPYEPTKVPSVFDTRALPALYPGTVRRYRLRFRGPRTPAGFHWLISFGEARRAAKVYLNGHLLGRNTDPYTPFALPARGLKPGQRNTLVVIVDSRKDPRVKEGWWNWGGIVRAVKLVPVGHAYLSGLGFMSRVRCRGPARSCKASLLLDSTLERRVARAIKPAISLTLRSPRGRIVRKFFKLPKQRSANRRLRLTLRVPAPELWSPAHPRLYTARLALWENGHIQQLVKDHVGLRSVTVKHGYLYLNNRPLQLRGASIHEDMPGDGAALTRRDIAQIVSDLKELGANATRAHYLLDQRLLDAFDRAGIMVWNEAPIWHRDILLRYPGQRKSAWLTVRRTVKAGRSHPSVITHSVANELAFSPDDHLGTRRFLVDAARYARDLDPTLPISVDIKTRPSLTEQFTYDSFDMLGLNQYFGWYSWVPDFSLLEPFIQQMRDFYPGKALVMTEFGAEGLQEMADAPMDKKGGYLFQAEHAGRTLDVVDRSPYLSGAIYWTLREFEIYPGWSGGAPRPVPDNTRHHKGLLTYAGIKKPAWYVVHDDYVRTPLYASAPRGRR